MSTPVSSEASATNQTPSMEAIKNGMRTTWMSGDYGKIAAIVAGAAEEFVHRIAPKSGAHVLDVACGTGNVTLPLAKAGAVVTGVDIAPNLLDEARKRAAAEGLTMTFDEGDAERLPYADGSFDMVVSMFGAMFAPRPESVVKEFARVLKPGGMLAMANWTRGSFTGQIFKVTSQHVRPTPGIPSPLLWGDTDAVRMRLGGWFADIRTETVPTDFDLPMSSASAAALFRRYYGPTKTAFAKLDENGQAALGSDLDALWSGACVSDPHTHTSIKNEYLQVIASRANEEQTH